MSSRPARLVFVLLVACGTDPAPAESSQEPATEATPQPPSPGPEPTGSGLPMGATLEATAPRSALDSATACARAEPCCAAYVEVIGDPVETERARIACEQLDHLEQLGEASGEACIAALDGWRRALEEAGRTVPAACR